MAYPLCYKLQFFERKYVSQKDNMTRVKSKVINVKVVLEFML
jgi:hypothetical protein